MRQHSVLVLLQQTAGSCWLSWHQLRCTDIPDAWYQGSYEINRIMQECLEWRVLNVKRSDYKYIKLKQACGTIFNTLNKARVSLLCSFMKLLLFLTTETCVQSQVTLSWICIGHCGTGMGFSMSTLLFAVCIILPMPHTNSYVTSTIWCDSWQCCCITHTSNSSLSVLMMNVTLHHKNTILCHIWGFPNSMAKDVMLHCCVRGLWCFKGQ